MKNLYIKINNYQQPDAIYTIDCYIPLSLSIQQYYPSSSEIFYLQFKDDKNLIETTLGSGYGELYNLSLIFTFGFQFYDVSFDDTRFLNSQMAAYFNFEWKFKPSNGIIPVVSLERHCSLEVFSDAIKINLTEIANGRLLFYQSPNFGIITDDELQVVGFIVKGLSKANHQELVDYAKHKQDYSEKIFTENNERFFKMNDYKYLIPKIFELKNTNYWKLIKYGYEVKLIDNIFLIYFASEIIMHNKDTDFIAIDIAALAESEAEKAEPLLNEKIKFDSLTFDEKKSFNKIWLYLTTAADLSKNNII